MKTTIQTRHSRKNKGFSLVEALVAIAILGIITALVVPVVANVTDRVGASTDHRNAQTLASMATNAIASGNLTILEAKSTVEVVKLLVNGVSGSGSFDSAVFQVQTLSEEELDRAIQHLSWDGGSLQYQAS
jgi:prepilin-type N-terminal cleavage/methylation domain-containing protein